MTRMPRVLSTAAAAIALALAPLPSGAQGTVGLITGRITARPDSLVVSLITVGPGGQLFDRFGHSAIRVQNAATGLDSAWNWGMYDFNAPNFITRFLTGDTQYWMAGYPTEWIFASYRAAGRTMWEQELAFAPAAADSLLAFLRWNARDENKFYRYDYYLDNCSTRIRDALDAVTGGAIKRALATGGAGVTWRGETLRLSGDFPAIAFGMTFALGRRADETLTPWDEAFIPMRLRDALRTVRIADATGSEAPLVRSELQLEPPGHFVDAAAPPSYVAPAVVVGTLLAVVIGLLGRAARTSRAARAAVQSIGTVWHLLAGVAGSLVLMAGLFTRHEFMAANTSVLLGTPVSLALAIVYARGWSPSAGIKLRRSAHVLSVFTVAAASAAVLAYAMPAVGPRDLAPVLLVLPVHAALAYTLGRAVNTRHGQPDGATA